MASLKEYIDTAFRSASHLSTPLLDGLSGRIAIDVPYDSWDFIYTAPADGWIAAFVYNCAECHICNSGITSAMQNNNTNKGYWAGCVPCIKGGAGCLFVKQMDSSSKRTFMFIPLTAAY